MSDFDTNHVWRKLCAGQAKISRSIDESLRRSGCVPLEWVGILFDIQWYGNGRIRLGELAERSSLSRSGITRLIDRMVEGGVISREACEHDGRGTYAVMGIWKRLCVLQEPSKALIKPRIVRRKPTVAELRWAFSLYELPTLNS